MNKRMVYVPVVSIICIVIPAYVILLACFTTDIIDNVCIPWGVYNGVAAEKSVASLIIFVEYLLPLTLMIFSYSRIVYTLRTKVSTHRQEHVTHVE